MENIKKFTKFLDELIELKGFLENIDGFFIEQGLTQGMEVLDLSHPKLTPIIDKLMGAIADRDIDEIIRKNALLLGEIVVLLKK